MAAEKNIKAEGSLDRSFANGLKSWPVLSCGENPYSRQTFGRPPALGLPFADRASGQPGRLAERYGPAKLAAGDEMERGEGWPRT